MLSGDNALVIALACRGLAPKQRVLGMVFGAGAAVVLRIIFTGVVATLMGLPYLKLAGGVALLVIAAKLLVPEEEEDDVEAAAHLDIRHLEVCRPVSIISGLQQLSFSSRKAVAILASSRAAFSGVSIYCDNIGRGPKTLRHMICTSFSRRRTSVVMVGTSAAWARIRSSFDRS